MKDIDDYSNWQRRRRSPFFPMDIDSYFDEIDKYFEEIFNDIQTNVPNDMLKERDLPDGSRVQEMGPFIYGYSVSLGPDGKPLIREFGNIKPSLTGKNPLELSDKIEPLIDIFEEKDNVKVIAELPGIEKNDINLELEGRILIISVNSSRKYYKKIELPTEVDATQTRAIYKNGILEVTIKKVNLGESKGKRIKID